VVVVDPEFKSHAAIDFESVRFRRPETPVYDPEVPSKPAEKALGTLDCERSEEFFARENLAAIRTCLQEKSSIDLDWTLRKEGRPTLELRHPEDAPECFQTLLREIPFPRELVYVVPGETPTAGECFTSRLDLETGTSRLRVHFPLREAPASEAATERTLRAWVLSVFRGGSAEKGVFHGRFLPTRYCLRCLGISENVERGAATVPAPTALWPFRAAGESVR
jgi:hypothetical protein